MDKEKIISEIIKLELEMTLSISAGFKPHTEDKFTINRELLKTYREILNG